MTSPTPFDANMARWIEEQRTPWNRLKYAVTRANLQRHLPAGSLRILDAGGGNGYDSLPLAGDGHHVTIVDFSPAMLADAARTAASAGVAARVSLHHADVATVAQLFPAPSFDLVLCHNVVQYVADLPALLAALVATLKPGGLLSLMSVNRYSVPYHAAFFRGDLAEAYATLDQRSITAYIFNATMQLSSGDELAALLPPLGCSVAAHYGVRCVYDYWGDNARKADPAVQDQLLQLELALTDRHPYKLLARYFQVIARKQ